MRDPARSQTSRNIWRQVRQMRWFAVLLGIVLLGLLFSQLSPAFLQLRNLQNIAVQAAVTGVMAVGMTFIIMTAGIDISVGGILYLTVAAVAWLTINVPGDATIYAAYPIALLLGALLGAVNGTIVNVLGLNSLVTTLATLSIFRGLAIHITEARILIPPDEVRFLGIGSIAGLPAPLLVALLTVVIGVYLLNSTRFGRYTLAIGASQRSARESGLPVRRTLIMAYVAVGLCTGLAALILLGRVGAVQSDMGIGIEFTVITAVVLGGTSLSGGRGSMLGSFLGAILLVMIDNGLNLINASPFIYDIVRGGVLVAAVLLDKAAAVEFFRQGLPFGRSTANPAPSMSEGQLP